MSSDFAADVEAYYEVKRPYTELLKRIMTQGPPKEHTKSDSESKDSGTSPQFVFAGGSQISEDFPRLDFEMLRKARAESKETNAKGIPAKKT
ncbi:hypothetical protein MMC08_001021 [Hypocenomyce scalaris]|nr:hypothetical protein [Hypocenomyce scalaris]